MPAFHCQAADSQAALLPMAASSAAAIAITDTPTLSANMSQPGCGA